MSVIQIHNATELEFEDISSEEWREYSFADGSTVRIEQPLKLHAGENGHRILDAEGISHYVPKKWNHLKWKSKADKPNFVK